MKLILALAAIMFAFAAVAAEASSRCDFGAESFAPPAAIAVAGAPDCHDLAEPAATDRSHGCEFAAFCALLCGVVPPAGPESALAKSYMAVSFQTTVIPLTGVLRRPEAPPPRMRLL